ncbi:hypothetical protein CRENBAI_022058 [Crenichthys baileyi]|uniref:Uncharacterized protein n=1 Tax=Crenichthys baileyi TaxID=28760 RepID=A0AAV9SKQ8_9TELE
MWKFKPQRTLAIIVSPWGPLNGVKHKVRRTRKYLSPLLHPPVNLNHRGKDLFPLTWLRAYLLEIPILSADPVRIPE